MRLLPDRQLIVTAGERQLPRRRLEHPRDEFDEACLSRSVGPREQNEFASCRRDIHIPENAPSTAFDRKPFPDELHGSPNVNGNTLAHRGSILDVVNCCALCWTGEPAEKRL
jgi:hypothetical protein